MLFVLWSKGKDKQYHREVIEEVEKLRSKWLTDRSINFYLDGLYELTREYDKGIKIYSEFIRNKEIKGEKDKDWADAHFNRACDYALKYLHTTKSRREKAIIQKNIENDLAIAIKFDPSNKTEVLQDEHLKILLKEKWFRTLLA